MRTYLKLWINILIQTWLFTGLFITAHDAMHGTISPAKKVNILLGSLSTFLFAGMWYPRLIKLKMALLFNIGLLFFSQMQLLLLWILPSILATFQLFYVGTYLPHRLPHTPEMEPYKARSQRKNHILAFFSCFFFGYHYEHHAFPETPWWMLYKKKELN